MSVRRAKWRFAGLRAIAMAALAGASAVAASGASPARAAVPTGGDEGRAARAREAILELDVVGARKILEGADVSDPLLALERARLAVFEGDCDFAAALLSRSDLSQTAEGGELGAIAQGCARATAGTEVVADEAHGVVVRLQDDEDRALVPLLADVAARQREVLAKDLGVRLPVPMRIELVRDHFTLAAMTGLPEEAARTTGTVAVAKWGRVTMLSPRAMEHGYPWLDTLAHELTHLTLTAGTRDKAPLWMQEGVAKREEVRWREHDPLDDVPPVDATAAIGLEKGLGRPIDKLGPSIAMLPTAEHASVAFAEVTSFIRYFVREVGDDGLPQLVVRLEAGRGPGDFDRILTEMTQVDFATWDKRWRAYLESAPRELPPDLAPGGAMPKMGEIVRRVRLGELLEGRGHAAAAAIEHARAQALAPFEASVRCHLAEALLAAGDRDNAAPLVDKVEDLHGRYGRWWSLHGLLHPADAERSFGLGVALDPLTPGVACEEKTAPELPIDAIRRALCEAARRAPVPQ
jgi:hypothetical protein